MNAIEISDKEMMHLSSNIVKQGQYLTFTLNQEIFAIGILAIKEIIGYTSTIEIPAMPTFIRGVINLRGAVVPVIDLSVRFGKKVTQINKRTCIVIVEIKQNGQCQDIGVMVDAVNEVLEISKNDIKPPPSFSTHIRADLILGMGKVHEKLVIILNLSEALSIDEVNSIEFKDERLANEFDKIHLSHLTAISVN